MDAGVFALSSTAEMPNPRAAGIRRHRSMSAGDNDPRPEEEIKPAPPHLIVGQFSIRQN